MVRVPLEELVLQIHLLALGPAGAFLQTVLQPPPAAAVEAALKTLRSVGALAADEQLTPLGRNARKVCPKGFSERKAFRAFPCQFTDRLEPALSQCWATCNISNTKCVLFCRPSPGGAAGGRQDRQAAGAGLRPRLPANAHSHFGKATSYLVIKYILCLLQAGTWRRCRWTPRSAGCWCWAAPSAALRTHTLISGRQPRTS